MIGDADLRRRLGERGRAWVVAERSWATLAARYLDVYAGAADRGRELDAVE